LTEEDDLGDHLDGLDVVQLGKDSSLTRLCGPLQFLRSDQQKKVSMLSGGERNRVHLARMLKEEANVLLLDEPTNDLDVNTMRALEEHWKISRMRRDHQP